MKEKKLFIFGNNNFAIMVKSYFQAFSEYDVVGFVADSAYISVDSLDNLPVIPLEKCLEKFPNETHYGFVAIGYTDINRIRQEKIQFLKKMGYQLATYIDPSSRMFPLTKIGENCFVMENVVIQPNVTIKDGVFIISQAYIAHDVVINDFVFICAGATVNGYCTVGRNCFIGSNSTINDNVLCADYTVVSAGAHVVKNTTKYGMYMSPNAKNIMKNVVADKENLEEAQKYFFNKSIKRN